MAMLYDADGSQVMDRDGNPKTARAKGVEGYMAEYDQYNEEQFAGEKYEQTLRAIHDLAEKKQFSAREQTIDLKDALAHPEKYEDYFTWENLIKKEPIHAVQLGDIDPTLTRGEIIANGIKNAERYGTDKNGIIYIHVDDTGTEVGVANTGLRHGLDRRLRDVQPIVEYIGEILKNSVVINTANARKIDQTGTYDLLGIAQNKNGDIYYAILTVNRYTDQIEDFDVLYAVKQKKNRLSQ